MKVQIIYYLEMPGGRGGETISIVRTLPVDANFVWPTAISQSTVLRLILGKFLLN